ncbi:PC4-domain-containing protein [Peniophora sp. CONT]|nr:PC4-domain-containing protein [Peniophora sp. CONT]
MAPKRKPVQDSDSDSDSEPIKKPRAKQTAKKSPQKRARDNESSEDDAPLSKPKSKAENPLTAKKPRISGASTSTSKKPTTKKAPVVEEDEDEEEEDAEEEAEGTGRIVVHTSTDGDKYVDLGKKKRASVRVFKGAVMVDIREFYGEEDDLKPGKKGISLNLDQWKALLASVGTIDKLVDRKK